VRLAKDAGHDALEEQRQTHAGGESGNQAAKDRQKDLQFVKPQELEVGKKAFHRER
jgi:hypothetical protein